MRSSLFIGAIGALAAVGWLWASPVRGLRTIQPIVDQYDFVTDEEQQ